MMVVRTITASEGAATPLLRVEGLLSGGCSAHPHAAALRCSDRPSAARDTADFLHCLCKLYGGHPTMVERAVAQITDPPARAWAMEALSAFARERHALVTLVAAVGPQPSTTGAAQTESTLQAQRRAIETLGTSERRGCALGAVAALVTDWSTVRALLDHAGEERGVELPQATLPDAAATQRIVDGVVDLAPRRAFSFGAEQLLLQHAGLFDLLEARAEARDKVDGIA